MATNLGPALHDCAGTLCIDLFNKNCYHSLPVESEEGVLDIVKLIPLEPGHLGIVTIPVVVAIACLCILITCKAMVQGVAGLAQAAACKRHSNSKLLKHLNTPLLQGHRRCQFLCSNVKSSTALGYQCRDKAEQSNLLTEACRSTLAKPQHSIAAHRCMSMSYSAAVDNA